MALHFLGRRQHGDQMAVGAGGGGASSSSIALLQARFRQLEKMREKREEMELLKVFSESHQTISCQTTKKQYEQTRNLQLVHRPPAQMMIYHHQPNATTTTATAKTRPSFHQDSTLSLELDLLYGKGTEQHYEPTISRTNPPFRDFWSMDDDSLTVLSTSSSRSHEKPDHVDTSLHL